MGFQGGFGIKTKITVSAALTVIAGITGAEFPEFEKVLTESTAHDASGGWATHVDTGKRKLNSFKVTMNWDKAASTHAAIVTAFNATAPVNITVESPDGNEVIAFAAHIAKMGRVADQEGMYSCEVEIQPTGAPTVT